MYRGSSRAVSGIIAALIILLMFVGIVILYEVYIRAQQRIFQAQREAVRLQEELAAVSRSTLLYYTIINGSSSYIAEIIAENRGTRPVTIVNLLIAYSYANQSYAVVVLGNRTDEDAPRFDELATLIEKLAGVKPDVNITVIRANGVNESLPGLPATIGPGDRLVIDLGPLPLDFKILSLVAQAGAAITGGSLVSTLITPKYAQPVVASATIVPPTNVGTGQQNVLFDVVTWVYAVPVQIECLYDRYNWPTAILVNFTAAGINYQVDPLGIRLLDLDNNAYVPVNTTKIGDNYFVIVFPLTCKAGEKRNFTIYAAGGPLSHPEGFYPVGLARTWDNQVVYEQGVNYYADTQKTYYILLEAPLDYLDPLTETELANYEQATSQETSISLNPALPYYDTSLSSVYEYSDIRLNESSGVVDAIPSLAGLASSSHALAPAWLTGWKYYIEIDYTNQPTLGGTAATLSNLLVNVSTDYLPSSVVSHLFAHARSDGGDIIFVDLDTGQLLQFATIRWDPANQRAEWLVKIPYLDPGQTIRIGLYYGNPVYNKSLETRVDLNPDYLVTFLRGIQAPSIHGYAYNYTFVTLPYSTWSRIYEATNKATPDATTDYLNGPLAVQLPSGITFPYYGVSYDTGDWYGHWQGAVLYDSNIQVFIAFALLDTSNTGSLNLNSGDNVTIEWYFNTSYSDELGSGLAIRYNISYGDVRYFFIWPTSVYIFGYLNGGLVLYNNGVIRMVYGDAYLDPNYQAPMVYVALRNESIVVLYTHDYYTALGNHPDVLFIPYFVLPVQLPSSYNFAISFYTASLSASSVALKGYSGGGFTVFHWRSSTGVYAVGLDVVMWYSWAGDILLTLRSLPLLVADAQLNYTIGFAPGIAGDPGIVVESDADSVANTLNLTAYATGSVASPPKELLLLRYNDSYVVYTGKAKPLFPWVVGWLHGLRVLIENPNSFSIENYVVRVVLGSQNLTDDYLSSPYFGKDIRVLDAAGNRLSFYVSYYNVSEPLIVLWVKVPYLPANGNTQIYIYYYAVPPTGVEVRDESNPYTTFIAYLEGVPGECPAWSVYNVSATYQCSSLTLGGYPSIAAVSANLSSNGLVRFYNTSAFVPSGAYGYEYRAIIIPLSAVATIDAGVELVPQGGEESDPLQAGSYGVVFSGGSLVRLVAGSLVSSWDQGNVQYSVGQAYEVVIKINETTMETLVYNLTSGELVASATDTGLSVTQALEAAIVSYSSSPVNAAYGLLPDYQGTGVFVSRGWWVRPWVPDEPRPVSALLLS